MTWLADLYVMHPFWIWLAVAGIILAAEVSTGSGWLLWPAACAAVVAVITLVLPDPMIHVALFAVLTIASTLLARRYLPRNASGDGPDINDNVGRLVGHFGMAVSAFENGRGRVFIDGKEWAAVADADAAPALDQQVKVISADGGILKVKAH